MFETEDWPKTPLWGRGDDTHRRKVRTLVRRNYYGMVWILDIARHIHVPQIIIHNTCLCWHTGK